MKKLIYLLFICSAVLCYLATRPSHGPNALPALPSFSSATQQETKSTNAPVSSHIGLDLLPAALRPFGNAYYLKDQLQAKVGKNNWIPLSKLPKAMPHALVSIEDRRFYEHHGVDFDSIARAILVNIQADGVVQGASTLTQQLVKNTLLTDEQTLSRKSLEACLALELESRYSKDEILEMYLNTTYFGAGATGIKAAAATYFGLEPFQLSLPECALIAGLPYAPSALNPKENPKDSKVRRDLVLTQMSKYGFIRHDEAEAAKKEPIVLK